MEQHDTVVRGGTLVDGTGNPPFVGDLAIDGGRITRVGHVPGSGSREIAAHGLLVTPGFVDIHTHYDAQATWDPYLSPSSQHGVTTVVAGNCGVGFAPARPDQRGTLIDLMEGVEDIPGAAMHEGIAWEWESFPEFIDALDRRPLAIDIGVQVPHCAVRLYVMGDRGARNEAATPEDIREMARIVGEGIAAGALGFSTSRTELHKTLSGEAIPGTFAELDEMFGIGEALRVQGRGVFQLASTHRTMDQEVPWMKELARRTGRIVTFNLQQVDERPDLYRKLLGMLDEAAAEGVTNLRGQFSGRPVGVLMGWQTSAHPFFGYPSYQKIAGLPFAERIQLLRDPEFRNRVLAENPVDLGPFGNFVTRSFHKMYPLGTPLNYEPSPDQSVAALAKGQGRSPLEVAYDLLMEQEGRAMLYFPLFGYSGSDFNAILETMLHPQTGLSLADGGAHCGAICDAGMPTFMLTHWVRDRSRGPKVSLEWMVRRQTHDTARQYGLHDRGTLEAGMRADINLIDFARLRLTPPEMVFDLPAGGRRLVQGAEGYVMTLVAGVPIFQNGSPTGAMPGRVIRGPQPPPGPG